MKKERFPKETVYYDSFESDFVGNTEGARKIDGEYEYIRRGFFSRLSSFFLYRILATPAAFIYCKLFIREKIIGRKKLKGHKAYFLYAAHNETVADAFSPGTVTFPKKAYTVIHPDNTSLPVIGRFLRQLGGLPTPSDLRSVRNFTAAVREVIDDGCAVVIYPEAHVWPKCTLVRPFAPGSFDVAAGLSAPVFSVKRVYKKQRLFGWRAVSYIDGPFYPDSSVPKRERTAKLASEVEQAMKSHLCDNEVELIKYVRRDV